MAVKCILVGQTPSVLDGVTENVQTQLDNKQSTITANGVLKGDGAGNITAAEETEVELVDLPQEIVWVKYTKTDSTYNITNAAEILDAYKEGNKAIALKMERADSGGVGNFFIMYLTYVETYWIVTNKNYHFWFSSFEIEDDVNTATSATYPYQNAKLFIQEADGILNDSLTSLTIYKAKSPTTTSKKSISLVAANWAGTASPYTQNVKITGSTATSQVDIQADATAIQQMMNDGTNAIYVANNNGTFTAYAVGEKPTANLHVQFTVYDVMYNGVDSVLNNNSWSMIRAISDRGEGENYWNVGDTKSITINGKIGNTTVNQTINAVILGFNHNSSKEGNNRIHFLIGKSGDNICGMTDSQHGNSVSEAGWCSMNTSQTNSGGWNDSYMRKTFLGNTGTPTAPVENTFLAALPADLRAKMKSCTKYSDNTGGNSSSSSAVTATTDYLFLLAEFEVFGKRSYANTAEQNSQVQYDYFKAGNSWTAGSWETPATTLYWWLRSVYAMNGVSFCRVGTSSASQYAGFSNGVLAGFCV